MEETYLLGVERQWLDEDLVPFAVDHGGNFFCVDDEGALWFCATDSWSDGRTAEENREEARRRIVSSLSAFVDGLVDERSVAL